MNLIPFIGPAVSVVGSIIGGSKAASAARQGAEDNGDQLYNGRVASSITVMEVAA